ncbi:hypothetical protein [Pedobacter metabolipauper]|uniref:Uncharacterized protein n=1 Tax=Pedobacter metabolipauper TaxID=425513 RepID=A0A4R6SZG5_9SPHI|nr:hypothetical protein [Pedobacter metabolipauper]TDQ11159.1 hypothetical protein ATK78_0274 [Pedobacter metabolipauper]
MKRIILAVIFGVASLSSISTKAQINLSINIGSQPQWGPSGYDHVEYYYLPDIEAYYNVPAKQYYYQDNGRWIHTSSLPARYRSYDLYRGYKVVMNSPKPYLSHNNNVKQYSKYKGNNGKQIAIRDSKKNSNDRNHSSYANGRAQRPEVKRNDDRNSGNNNQKGNRRG